MSNVYVVAAAAAAAVVVTSVVDVLSCILSTRYCS